MFRFVLTGDEKTVPQNCFESAGFSNPFQNQISVVSLDMRQHVRVIIGMRSLDLETEF